MHKERILNKETQTEKQKDMITERSIENLCSILRIDKNKLAATLNNVHEQGYVFPNDIRHLTEFGIPVINVMSNILNMPTKKACELCTETINKETKEVCPPDITYEDLLVVLGIIAQDFEVRKQQAILRKHEVI